MDRRMMPPQEAVYNNSVMDKKDQMGKGMQGMPPSALPPDMNYQYPSQPTLLSNPVPVYHYGVHSLGGFVPAPPRYPQYASYPGAQYPSQAQTQYTTQPSSYNPNYLYQAAGPNTAPNQYSNDGQGNSGKDL